MLPVSQTTPPERTKAILQIAACLLLALLGAGCATEPEDVPLSGTWTGRGMLEGDPATFTWDLRESGGVIAGSASFTFPPVTYTGDVTGSYTHPDIRMTLVIFFGSTTLTVRWVGTRTSDDVLTGILHDWDGGQSSLTLQRAS